MNHFGDPGYKYHTLMSQLWGVTALRMANADLLPFDFATYARNIRQFVNDLSRANKEDISRQTRLDLQPILAAIDEFESAGKKLHASLDAKRATGPIDPALATRLNHGMMQVERNWLNPDGIPGRPWFKHILYGARYTYAHLELPGLTEAVEKQDWPTAKDQAQILRKAIERNTKLLNELNAEVSK